MKSFPAHLKVPLSHLGSAYLIGASPAALELSVLEAEEETVRMRLGVPLGAVSGIHKVGDKAEIIIEVEVIDG